MHSHSIARLRHLRNRRMDVAARWARQVESHCQMNPSTHSHEESECLIGRRPVPQIGDAAPPLELAAPSGIRIRLEDFRGRSVLLSFLSHAA